MYPSGVATGKKRSSLPTTGRCCEYVEEIAGRNRKKTAQDRTVLDVCCTLITPRAPYDLGDQINIFALVAFVLRNCRINDDVEKSVQQISYNSFSVIICNVN